MEYIDSPAKAIEAGPVPVSPELRADTMAYAIQHAVYNVAANFFEPYINYRVQKHYAEQYPLHINAGNYTQNLAGEFAGDITGVSTLILAEALFPQQLHYYSRKIRGMVDPLYTAAAQRIFAKDKDASDYGQKIEKWKISQERNLVRAAVIGAASIAGNIATQKLVIGNPSPTKLIFTGKLLSTTLTTTLALGARLMLPNQTKGLDKWVGKNIFMPLLTDEETPADSSGSHAGRLTRRNDSPPQPGRS